MGVVLLLVLLAGLAVIPYRVGRDSWWPDWIRSTWTLGGFCFGLFFLWYVVFLAVDGPGALVPLAMVVLIGAWCAGYRALIEDYKARRRQEPR